MNSIELSKKLNIRHCTVIRAIELYLKYFKKLGKIKSQKVSTPGRPFEAVYLNDRQVDFLVMLLKNKDNVVKLKFDIVNRL
jgi:hypothetical protein